MKRWCCALALVLTACPRRAATPPEAAVPSVPAAVDVVLAQDVPHATVGRGAQGPWRDDRLAGAAVSPAVALDDRRVLSLVAVPAADHSVARLSWVSWSAQGAAIVAQTDGPPMAPGAAIALLPREGGWTAVWSGEAGDAGQVARAMDLTPAGFAGAARAPTDPERAASRWALDAMSRRSRNGLDLPPQSSARGGLTVETRGATTIVSVAEREVLRGADLTGYAHAIDLAERGDTGWLAISRGRCRDTRVELWALRDGRETLRASFPIGVEVGVRWLRVEPSARAVVLTWYQDLIPLRIPCARGDGGASTGDHGVRVAAVVE